MSRLLTAFLMVAACAWGADAYADSSADEQQLISVLTTSATLQQKDAACAQLKRTGSAASVPALAALLVNSELSHSARYALESLPAPEAGAALADALDETTGLLQAAILASMQARRELPSLEKLNELVRESDEHVASAAASALGKSADPRAAELLAAALTISQSKSVASSIYDALLEIAHDQLRNQKSAEASSTFNLLLGGEVPAEIRAAAIAGLIASAEPARSLSLLLTHLKDEDGAGQQAALRMARELEAPGATEALAQFLPRLKDEAMQVALIEALHQRADVAAADVMMEMLDSGSSFVRMAAIAALGDIGDSEAVAPLAKVAATQTDDEQRAARRALLNLRRGNVMEAMIEQVVSGPPPVQREMVRTLTARGDDGAAAKLLPLAVAGNGSALQALGRLASAEDVPALAQFVSKATGKQQVQAAIVLQKACTRLRAKGASIDVTPFLRALSNGNAQTQVALLPAAVALNDPQIHDKIRTAVKSDDASIRQAAINALAETPDKVFLPELLQVAHSNPDEMLRLKALSSCLQVATDTTSDGLSSDERITALQQILPLAKRPEEKWAILSGLADTPGTQALELASTMLGDPDASTEAAQAVTKIAASIHASNPTESRTALQKVLSIPGDPAQTKAATAVLDQISTMTAGR